MENIRSIDTSEEGVGAILWNVTEGLGNWDSNWKCLSFSGGCLLAVEEVDGAHKF